MTEVSAGSLVWINGQLVPFDQAHIHVSDRGFTLGDGLFETMLWTGEKIRFLDDHLARLSLSAQELNIALPLSPRAIADGLTQLASQTQGKTAALRLTLTRGSGPRGLAIAEPTSPLFLATLAAFAVPATPVRLMTCDIRRNCDAPSGRHKTLSYVDNIMALAQACAAQADDAIMLGTNGNVACTSSANIIVRYKGNNLTPSTEDGALAGIVRGRLLGAGVIEEAHISATLLDLCDQCALTNALIGVRGVNGINDRYLTPEANWIERLNAALY